MTEEKEKYKLIIKKAGFKSATQFQEKVIPLALDNRHIIAETEKGCGRSLGIALPVILQTDFSYSGLKSLIIVSSAENAIKLNNLFKKLYTKKLTSLQAAAANPERNLKKDLRLLGRQPDIFIGTPDSIIDHIRSDNITLEGIQSCVIEDREIEDLTGFEKDMEFILSKLDGKQQFMVFTDRIGHNYSFYRLFKKPAIFRLQDEETRMNNLDQVQGWQIKKLLSEMKESGELNQLSEIKKLVKKNVPFLQRGFFTAYLLKKLGESNGLPGFSENERGEQEKTQTVFINSGKNKGFFARDIARLILSSNAVDRRDIAGIKVLDNYSFVEISNGKAARVINALNNTQHKGKKIAASFARNRKKSEKTRVSSAD